jgi:2-phospho-L-lactate guanylyltransferase
MLEDVLQALQAVPRLDAVSVVSPDEEVLRCARDSGAEALEEPASVRGINQALSHALSVMSTCGLQAILVLPADVPTVKPADIEAALDALPADRGAVICPSHDKGTSLLALRPPDVIPFRFGEHSFSAHKRESLARGVPCRVLRIDSLTRDIDEPDDLEQLLKQPAETSTHRLLAQLKVLERIGPGG